MESTNVGDIEKGKVDPIQKLRRTLLACDPHMIPDCCIFRVPEVLRSHNKAAYEPKIVSIGPIHRGGKQFELVEKVKKLYFTSLLSVLDISLEDLIKRVLEELEQTARASYADTFDRLDQDKFAEMLILDGCYLIQLFLKGPDKLLEEDEDNPINSIASFMLEYLYHDLLLLENQLPWCVLEFFYKLIEGDNTKNTLTEKVLDFFKPLVAAEAAIFSYPKPDVEILHILDLIRTALIQEKHQDQKTSLTTKKEQLKSYLRPRIPSAVTLLEAGVIFKQGPVGCIFDINFKDGVFTIPVLTIDEKTGPFFMNLLAYEKYSNCSHMITSYVVLMRNIIKTTKDVDLLCEKGILANWLWSAEDACKLVHEISKNTTSNCYNYLKLCHDVDQYQKSPGSQWMRVINFICIYRLKRDYFNTPWATISVFAAFVLLALTFLQTIYTMLPSDPHPAPAPG